MMDEDAFKETYRAVNGRPCVFAKAILTRCVGCSRSRKVLLAEREGITCLSPAGEAQCRELAGLLREKSLFALHMTHLDGPLPHGKEMRIQCGGLLGLQQLVAPAERVEDVEALVERLRERHGEFSAVPMGEVIKYVATYRPRQRRS